MRQLITCLLLTSVLLAHHSHAAEAKAFTTSLTAGISLADGNSETLQANAGLLSEGEKEGLGSVRAGAEGNYGETTTRTTDEPSGTTVNNNETTVDNAKVFLNTKKTLSQRFFGYIDTTGLYDDIAKIDYRATIGPGLGAYAVKNERTTLSAEVGPSYVWEKVDSISDDYLAVRFEERFTHKISDTAHVWQSAEFLPKAEDFGNYLLNAEAGIEAAMNASVALRLVIQNKYDSEPGANLEQNDLTLIGGLSVKI